MKKIIPLIVIFLLTGCFGEVGRGNLTVICEKEEKVNFFSHQTTYEIKFKNNNVYHVTKTDSYLALDSSAEETVRLTKLSADNYNNALTQTEGISVKIVTNQTDNYTFSLELEMEKLNDDKISEMGLSREYNKLVNNLKNEGMICK